MMREQFFVFIYCIYSVSINIDYAKV